MVAFTPALASETVNLFGHVIASRAFAVGLVFGALAYFVSGLVAAFRHQVVDGAGIAFAAALVLAARDVYGDRAAPAGLIIGLVLLAVGGAVAARARPRIAVGWYVGLLRTAAALLPGTIVIVAAFPLHDPGWVRIAVGVGILLAAPLAHDFDQAQGAQGAPFLLLAVAVIAVYYTVPDTELPMVMVGCAIPLALLSVPQPLRRLGPAGSTAAIGAFVWVAAVGGRGRSASVLAAVAALGLLIVEPLARRVPKSNVALGKKRRARSRQTDNWLLVVGVAAAAQLALGAYCATIAGRATDSLLGAMMAAPALVLLAAAAPFIVPVRTPEGRIRHRSRSSGHGGSQHHHRTRVPRRA